MAAGYGLTKNIAARLEEPMTYRYTLYDNSNNEISDPDNNHVFIKSETSKEWVSGQKDAKLIYQGGNLFFGDAKTSWSNVDHMGVEVDIANSFRPLGAVHFDGGTYNVSEGNTFEVDVSSAEIKIDYTKGSFTPSGYKFDKFNGALRAFEENTREKNIEWQFTLVTNAGSHDTTKKKTSEQGPIWNPVSNGLEYQGSAIEWSVFKSSVTVDRVDIFLIPQTPASQTYYVGSANVGGTSASQGQVPSVKSGDLTLAIDKS